MAADYPDWTIGEIQVSATVTDLPDWTRGVTTVPPGSGGGGGGGNPSFRSVYVGEAFTGVSWLGYLPAGVQAGDLLIWFVVNGVAAGGPIASAGWNNIWQGGRGSTMAVLIRWATASEPSQYTMTGPNLFSMNAIAAYPGVSGLDGPVVAADTLVQQTAAVAPAVTTSGPSRTLVQCVDTQGNTSITTPSGYTMRGNDYTGTDHLSGYVYDQAIAAAGTVGPTNFPLSTTAFWQTMAVLLAP